MLMSLPRRPPSRPPLSTMLNANAMNTTPAMQQASNVGILELASMNLQHACAGIQCLFSATLHRCECAWSCRLHAMHAQQHSSCEQAACKHRMGRRVRRTLQGEEDGEAPLVDRKDAVEGSGQHKGATSSARSCRSAAPAWARITAADPVPGRLSEEPSLVVTTHSCACFRSSTPARPQQHCLLTMRGSERRNSKGRELIRVPAEVDGIRCFEMTTCARDYNLSQASIRSLKSLCQSVHVQSRHARAEHERSPAMTAQSFTMPIAFSNSTYSMQCSHPCPPGKKYSEPCLLTTYTQTHVCNHQGLWLRACQPAGRKGVGTGACLIRHNMNLRGAPWA